MATLYITEFTLLGKDNDAVVVPAAIWPPLAQQAVSISSTSAQSSALNGATRLVRLYSDTACWIEVAVNPTATTSKMPLPAGIAEYFCVPTGITLKIAGITT